MGAPSRDELLVAEIQDGFLAIAHGSAESDDAALIQRIVAQHGEDAVLEFIRQTVRGEKGHQEAGKQLFDDADAGAKLGVVVSRVIYGQIDGDG